MHLQRRDVHANANVLWKTCRFGKRRADNPLTHTGNQAILLGMLDKFTGVDQPALRMLPA